MANPGLSDDQCREALALYEEYGEYVAAAISIGLSENGFRNRVAQARARGLGLPEGQRLKGSSTLYDAQTGEAKLQWVKTDTDREQQEQILREMAETLAKPLPKVKAVTGPKEVAEDFLKFIPWGDPHFGLYCWKKEVGNDFNVDIASEDLCKAVAYLVSQGPPAKRCVIANLGDFFHSDNFDGTTPRNRNILDTDTRLPKVISVGISAVKTSIDVALKHHEIVEFISAPGNHDPVLGAALAIFLSHLYENEPRVIIHDDPTLRHYIRHGKVFIGVTHGDKTKDRDLPGIMATERPEDWGETRFRVFCRGHHHHDNLEEFNGCKVEQFRTLAPGDAYAVGRGYLSGRDMKAIIYDKEYGERYRLTCSIDLLRSL